MRRQLIPCLWAWHSECTSAKVCGSGTDHKVATSGGSQSLIIYFIYSPEALHIRLSPNLVWGTFPGNNELRQICQGFWFCRGSKFGLSHRNELSPLTQGLNYRSACEKSTNWVIGVIIASETLWPTSLDVSTWGQQYHMQLLSSDILLA